MDIKKVCEEIREENQRRINDPYFYYDILMSFLDEVEKMSRDEVWAKEDILAVLMRKF